MLKNYSFSHLAVIVILIEENKKSEKQKIQEKQNNWCVQVFYSEKQAMNC